MPMTTIQKLLGHRRLNSTMVYARVHNRTVAQDYFSAMAQVEQRLELLENEKQPSVEGDCVQLLALVDALQMESLDEGQQQTLQQFRTMIVALVE